MHRHGGGGGSCCRARLCTMLQPDVCTGIRLCETATSNLIYLKPRVKILGRKLKKLISTYCTKKQPCPATSKAAVCSTLRLSCWSSKCNTFSSVPLRQVLVKVHFDSIIKVKATTRDWFLKLRRVRGGKEAHRLVGQGNRSALPSLVLWIKAWDEQMVLMTTQKNEWP